MALKWIVENNDFKMGNVGYHFQLASDRGSVKGGGRYHVDREGKVIYLYGLSMDFGQCTKEEVKAALEDSPQLVGIKGFTVKFTNQGDWDTTNEIIIQCL